MLTFTRIDANLTPHQALARKRRENIPKQVVTKNVLYIHSVGLHSAILGLESRISYL